MEEENRKYHKYSSVVKVSCLGASAAAAPHHELQGNLRPLFLQEWTTTAQPGLTLQLSPERLAVEWVLPRQ